MADMYLVKSRDGKFNAHGVFHNSSDLMFQLRKNYPKLRGKQIEYAVTTMDCNPENAGNWNCETV